MNNLKIGTVSRMGVCACVCSLVLSAACGGGTRAVRGDDEPGLDYHAMSTGLDRRDLQKMLNEEREAVRALRFAVATNQESKVRKIRASRKTIARIEALGWSLHVGETLHDIDVPADLP